VNDEWEHVIFAIIDNNNSRVLNCTVQLLPMSIEKENFLRTKLVTYLQRLDPATPPRWGKMNVQQMIEHYAGDALRNANGGLKIVDIITPPENLDRMREFMMSNKPFKENTKNPLMAEEPAPLRYKTVQGAIGKLQQELICFFEVFEKNPVLITRNPFFGDLNFDQNVQLLYKHAIHHLRQFGAEPPSN
jgi:hypothetical protein